MKTKEFYAESFNDVFVNRFAVQDLRSIPKYNHDIEKLKMQRRRNIKNNIEVSDAATIRTDRVDKLNIKSELRRKRKILRRLNNDIAGTCRSTYKKHLCA